MKLSKKLILSSSAFAVLAAGALAVACSTTPGKGGSDNPDTSKSLQKRAEETLSDWTGTLKVAVEEDWMIAFDKAVSLLPENMRSRVEAVKIENGKSTDYIENTVSTSAQTAADLFPMPLDRIQGLIKSSTLGFVNESDLTEYGENKKLVKLDDKFYGFPLNIESVFMLYDNSVYPQTPTDITAEFNDPVGKKFVFKAADLWMGATMLNGLFTDIKNGSMEEGRKMWVTEENGQKTAPFLTNDKTKQRIKDVWTYYNKLRTGSNEKYKIVTNSNTSRDVETRSGIANQSISLTFDGPWILKDLVQYILKQNESTPAKVVEVLNKISAGMLPKLGTEQLRHFIGGWAYALNKTALGSFSTDTKAVNGKANFASYFASVLTSKNIAAEWVHGGGKVSAASGYTLDIDVSKMTFRDPSTKIKMDISKYTSVDGFEAAIKNFYESVIKAVTGQYKINMEQPKWPGGGYWTAWDANGLTSTSYATADAFLEALTKNVDLELKKP
ncbi:hypothetical protein ACA758_02710 [Mycoplasmopsis agassizii]|uniref:extracellular solute-binding protein n=1 Tax=Mycoplasmopsis agassizii TaxID=33922 RepID=UPI003527999F